jgi:cell division protein ZapA
LKQLDVQIMGQSYLLGCPEGGEQRLLEAVEKVDSAMCKIRDAGKVKARDRIAVLASLNMAFQMAELEGRAAAVERASPGVAGLSVTEGAPLEANDARLGALLSRLDSALGDDGRLL